MPGKSQVLLVLLFALLALGGWFYTGKSDVTGSFGLGVSFHDVPCESVAVLGGTPLADQPCERVLFKFDIESEINVNIAISGLTLGIHSHIGATGLEDVILSFLTTLGALDLAGTLVFAQPFGLWDAPDGQSIPVCYEDAPGSGVCQLFFVTKLLSVSVTMGGLKLSNLAVLEDVNFPNPGARKPPGGIFTLQSQSFGFGDLITISGETPSGISVESEVGICVQKKSILIKKHSFSPSVNPDCQSGAQPPSVKPPFFFDFETITISAIPLTSRIFMDLEIFCSGQIGCRFMNSWTFKSSVLFDIVLNFAFENFLLGPISFGAPSVTFESGILTATVSFNALLQVSALSAIVKLTLNPDTNPASLHLTLRGKPTVGITFLSALLTIKRAGIVFTGNSSFSSTGGTPTFSALTLALSAEVSMVEFSAGFSLGPKGFVGGNIQFGITF